MSCELSNFYEPARQNELRFYELVLLNIKWSLLNGFSYELFHTVYKIMSNFIFS